MHQNIYSNNFLTSVPTINLLVGYHTTVFEPPYHSVFIKENRDFYGVIYTISGEGFITINGEDIKLSAGEFIISTQQKVDSIKSDKEWSFLFFWFQTEFNSLKTDEINYCLLSPLQIDNFLKIIDLINIQKPEKMMIANSIFTEELFYLINNSKQNVVNDYHDKIEKCIKYINENLEVNFKIEKLASICCVGEKHFRFLFKKYIGISPKQYIINARLEKAKYLLQFLDLSITDISYNLCFASSSHFTLEFKNRYNITPNAYRKNIKNNIE